mmetsp:Transcript_6646/g.19492  ORF Transcript_6646/g.19492 Transcript_6646/m.19492 type:complete len:211 (+) Transcript_6646:1712-2344(+)
MQHCHGLGVCVGIGNVHGRSAGGRGGRKLPVREPQRLPGGGEEGDTKRGDQERAVQPAHEAGLPQSFAVLGSRPIEAGDDPRLELFWRDMKTLYIKTDYILSWTEFFSAPAAPHLDDRVPRHAIAVLWPAAAGVLDLLRAQRQVGRDGAQCNRRRHEQSLENVAQVIDVRLQLRTAVFTQPRNSQNIPSVQFRGLFYYLTYPLGRERAWL